MTKSNSIINLPFFIKDKLYLVTDSEPEIGDFFAITYNKLWAKVVDIVTKKGKRYIINDCNCGECTTEDRTTSIEFCKKLVLIHYQPDPFSN